MALDADVGWLWHVTEPDGEYSADHGEAARSAEAAKVAHLFDVALGALSTAGLERHREPRWPDPISPPPERVRMGFYSSDKYQGLNELVAHVFVHRRAPHRRDEIDLHAGSAYESARRTRAPSDPPRKSPRAFDHLYFCGVSLASTYVPIDFEEVLVIDPIPDADISRIGSSLRLERECLFLLNLYDWLSEKDPDYDWEMAYGEHSLYPGCWERAPEGHEFQEEIDLAGRLLRVARLSLRMGAAVTFS